MPTVTALPPWRIDPMRGGAALHDAAATRALEAAALATAPAHALMQRAGLAVARLARATTPTARLVHVLAGPGNNGGDALVAATHLHLAGLTVRVSLLGDPEHLPADATDALARARAAGLAVDTPLSATTTPDLVIDGLLGLGARRAPAGAIADAIARANASGAPILAIDLPSGLHPDTGQPLGAVAIRATTTLSLLTLKPGLFTGAGRDHAGEVWLDDLGVDLSSASATAWLSGAESMAVLPARAHATHKGSYGDVIVVGGAPGMTGAARLAARAALAAGAGRVYLSLLDPDADPADAQRSELMSRREAWAEPAAAWTDATVACGCGGGPAVGAALPALLAHARRLVLDADALNRIAEDGALASQLAARAGRGQPTVLTPHPLEAARLLGGSAGDVQRDRVAAAVELAGRTGATVVLKGSGTVVAAPGRLPAINGSGNALLAGPGTGDVLAGWLAGLWSASGAGADEAARAAVWLHGHAADREADAHGARWPLRAADLIDAMRGALR